MRTRYLGIACAKKETDLSSVPSLDEIAREPSMATNVSPDVARALTMRCAAVLAALAAIPSETPQKESQVPEERLLGVEEAASRLGVSKDYLYRQGSRLPFTVRVGRRLRFSATGLARYIRARQGR